MKKHSFRVNGHPQNRWLSIDGQRPGSKKGAFRADQFRIDNHPSKAGWLERSINKTLLVIFTGLTITGTFAHPPPPERVVDLDFNQIKGPLNTLFKECVGAGRANEGLRADWQKQLAYVRKECGFKYIRM